MGALGLDPPTPTPHPPPTTPPHHSWAWQALQGANSQNQEPRRRDRIRHELLGDSDLAGADPTLQQMDVRMRHVESILLRGECMQM